MAPSPGSVQHPVYPPPPQAAQVCTSHTASPPGTLFLCPLSLPPSAWRPPTHPARPSRALLLLDSLLCPPNPPPRRAHTRPLRGLWLLRHNAFHFEYHLSYQSLSYQTQRMCLLNEPQRPNYFSSVLARIQAQGVSWSGCTGSQTWAGLPDGL